MLAHLREGQTFAQVAVGFEVGTTTAWPYVHKTTALLAVQAPTLEQGPRRARRKGWAYVIIDGTSIACDRVTADRPFYSGKYKQHGMNTRLSRPRTKNPCGPRGRCAARCTTPGPHWCERSPNASRQPTCPVWATRGT